MVVNHMGIPKIRSVGTAVPPFALRQEDIKQFAASLFQSNFEHLDRFLSVFENGHIQVRHLTRPLEWYGKLHSFAEANRIFAEVALELSETAAQQALDQAGIQPSDIGIILFVSSTGIATPSLDAKLIQRLGLSAHTARLPLWGLGCAGGVSGLARAAELSQSIPGKSVLLITAELCSLTFQSNDYSKANLVGSSLFADGAAAAVLTTDGYGPAILDTYSTLFPGSENVMGWDMIESGLKVRFSRDIPGIVRKCLPELINNSCSHWGIDQTQIRHHVVHPGGAKVLSAYSDSLGVPDKTLVHAYDILEHYGNMSSSSILFVLERFMAATQPTGDYGIMFALGPGFSAEQVLFQW